jgi:dipeptidyl aminopeptidase/acylaminoacyl peptidase
VDHRGDWRTAPIRTAILEEIPWNPEKGEGTMRCSRLTWIVVLLAVCVGIIIGCAERQVPIIPREVIFGNPEKAIPRISPDGKMLAYIAPKDDVLNIWVRTIGQTDDRVVTDETNRDLFRYFWAADSKHIMYLQDKDGDENWNLYSVNIETDEIRSLTPHEDVQVNIVDSDKHFPDELLISMNKDNPQLFDVYHLDIPTGEVKLVAKNPGNIVEWVVDTSMKVRGAVVPTPEGGFQLLVRDTEDSDWRELLTWGPEDALASGTVGFTKDGKYMYLQDSRDANASRLVKVDVTSGDMVEVLAEDPMYDVGTIMVNPDTYEPEAVVFDKARTEWVLLDESLRDDFDAFRALDDGDVFLTSRDNDYRNVIVGFTKDDGPIPYYAFDRETNEATFLFYHRTALNDYTLASMEPMSYNASDGRTIHGYITYPPGMGRSNLPLVLVVHGGPWYRDSWGYNPEAQWFANRGYACLQVNFRGSSGYGKQHINAGDREWGGKMHDDLIDAVNWAIDKGIADPDRIAIYGGSYGGYAALVGATFTPDVFACAVAAMGPSNLITFIQSIPPYWKPLLDLMYKRVGNPETEAEFLKSRSPLFKVDQIEIPMLIAQGANDVRVKQAESEQIVAAMRDKGIDHEYMLFEDEGHGFVKAENRLKFYAAVEAFLAKHLGGRVEE